MDERSQRSGYSRSRLDRTANRRGDPAWIAQALRSARFLLFSGDRPLFRISDNPGPDPLFDAGTAQRFDAGMDRAVFLGLDGDTALFAAPVPGDETTFDAEGIKLIDVRSVAVQGLVAPALLGPVAQAKSLLDWHARHGYCARCGASTRMADAGYRRDCPSCGASHFPRTDPVVIMLPVDGADCLLARAPRFQPGMYSALAGFVEPGETLEDAVRREVKEETAVDVDRVTYHSSQPWPFPSSLMIGCFARAVSRDLDPDPREIADARWFSRTEIGEMLNHRHPDGLFAPPSMAIAHQLLKSYVAGETIF
jgi:NAD+ diphosphatase